MNSKLPMLLTTALVTGLLAAQVAKAEDTHTKNTGDKMSAEKNGCKGMKKEHKNSCKGKKKEHLKKDDKNSCKNGCGEAKDSNDHDAEEGK